MPRRLLVAWLTAAGALAAAPSASAAVHHCADVGPAQTDTAVYRITATGFGCRPARRVLKRWYYDRSSPANGPRGWRCRVRSTGPYSERHTCRRDHRVLRFTLLSA
jgi:hypothetical protein